MTPEQQAAMRQMIEALNEVTGWQWAGPMRVMDEVEDAIRAGKAALEQQPADEPVAKAWDEGYRTGINDERMSESTIGIAGFNAKVEPARNNPYRTRPQPAAPDDDELTQVLIERDEAEAIADELAAKIAEITGDDIGEHTSGNCPWRKALEVADDWINRPQPAAQFAGSYGTIDESAAKRIATALGWEPKREWVGLTQQDIDIAFDDTQEGGGFNEFARAIEAKLREKNGK